MRWYSGVSTLVLAIFCSTAVAASAQEVSDRTSACLACHRVATPGVVSDWETSRHSHTTPAQALAVAELERRVSAQNMPDSLSDVVVGCAECHMVRGDAHPGSFDHNGQTVHTVVSPADCAVCHPVEWDEYQHNIMSKAHVNLSENPTYELLIRAANGHIELAEGELRQLTPDSLSDMASCYYCHGTRLAAGEIETRATMFGEMGFPLLAGWPNQGVGRINPDGTQGACTSCHPRHSFSIEVARKPHTCGECHKGPDVPAYKVYMVSKMGGIYSSLEHTYDFSAVPWVVGEDFTSPTCAGCHMSLLTDPNGKEVVPRTHQVTDRLYTRLFGLPYAHPQPASPNTSGIRNSAGLGLATELTGEPVHEALIDSAEQVARKETMKTVCGSCHTGQWVDGHFRLLDHVVEATNELTLTATRILQQAWREGLVEGPPEGSPFDETMERKWVEHWLFYANSTRYSAAMAGADYGVFENGRWWETKTVTEMYDLLVDLRSRAER